MPIEKICQFCGNKFHSIKAKYCSRKCANTVAGQISGKIKHEKRILNSPKNICQLCGKEYIVKSCDQKGTKYCSRKCANTAISRKNAKIKKEKYSSKEYLMSKIQIDKKTGCWNWKGSRHKQGYGTKAFAGKRIKTHRLFYEIFIGKIPERICVCHKCDNPPCCNPDHLFIGTYKDNMQDMIKKNRSNFLVGEKCKRASFKNEDILEIRRLYPSVTQAELARRYKRSEGAIASIIHRRSWKHI